MHIYIVVNEVNSKNFYTRRVYKIFSEAEAVFGPLGLSSYEIMQQMFPNKYGLTPTDLKAQNSISEHIVEKTKHLSRFISVSELQQGANYKGNLVFIDKNELSKFNVKTYSTQDIINIIDKTKNLTNSEKQRFKNIVSNDMEVLLAPKKLIPKQAIMTKKQMDISKTIVTVGKSIQILGIFTTIYDLEQATETSIKQNSFKPLMAETTRQIGGWGGALTGARIGAGIGFAFGLESGPCAILTTLGGAIIFGILGYNGADYIGDEIAK